MNASEIFGLIIRCAGLALSLIGINRIYRALIMASYFYYIFLRLCCSASLFCY